MNAIYSFSATKPWIERVQMPHTSSPRSASQTGAATKAHKAEVKQGQRNENLSTNLSRHDEAQRLDGVGRELEEPGRLALHHVETALGDHGHALGRRRGPELADGEAPRVLVDALFHCCCLRSLADGADKTRGGWFVGNGDLIGVEERSGLSMRIEYHVAFILCELTSWVRDVARPRQVMSDYKGEHLHA